MGLLDLFRKKEHRKKYEKTEKKLANKILFFENPKYERSPPSTYDDGDVLIDKYGGPDGHFGWIGISTNPERARKRYESGKRKLEKLYKEGHKEAIGLNKRYDALMANKIEAYTEWNKQWNKGKNNPPSQKVKDFFMKKIKNANNKLYNFEQKELGMHGENERYLTKRRKDLSTITGIISVGSLILASVMATNITGNVIGGGGEINMGSIIFLLVGLVFGIAWLFLRKR